MLRVAVLKRGGFNAACVLEFLVCTFGSRCVISIYFKATDFQVLGLHRGAAEVQGLRSVVAGKHTMQFGSCETLSYRMAAYAHKPI